MFLVDSFVVPFIIFKYIYIYIYILCLTHIVRSVGKWFIAQNIAIEIIKGPGN